MGRLPRGVLKLMFDACPVSYSSGFSDSFLELFSRRIKCVSCFIFFGEFKSHTLSLALAAYMAGKVVDLTVDGCTSFGYPKITALQIENK